MSKRSVSHSDRASQTQRSRRKRSGTSSAGRAEAGGKAYKRKEKEISTFYRKEKKNKTDQQVTSRRILEASRTEYLVKQGNYYCSDFISRCGVYRFEFIEKRNHYENWNYWSNGSRGQNLKRKIDRHDVMGTSRRFICFWFVRKTRGDCGSFRNW